MQLSDAALQAAALGAPACACTACRASQRPSTDTRLCAGLRRIYYRHAPSGRHAGSQASTSPPGCMRAAQRSLDAHVLKDPALCCMHSETQSCAAVHTPKHAGACTKAQSVPGARVRRVGDASKTGGLSAEFTLKLNASMAPASGVYPIRRAPPVAGAQGCLLPGSRPALVCHPARRLPPQLQAALVCLRRQRVSTIPAQRRGRLQSRSIGDAPGHAVPAAAGRTRLRAWCERRPECWVRARQGGRHGRHGHHIQL